MKIVILGGDAAGMSAASKLRRSLPQAQIVVFEQTRETSYGACGLPYYIGGVNDDADKIRIRKPEAFLKSGIDLRLNHEAVAVDPVVKTVTARNLETDELVTERYDELVVATGTSPILPPLEGRDKEGVFTLKSIADAQDIRAWAEQRCVSDVVIVGAGYIGLELAESFVRLKKRVTMIEMAPRPMMVMDEDFAPLISQALERHGVVLHTGEAVKSLAGGDTVSGVITDKGEYAAQLVILSVGVRPNTSFLRDTGVELLPNGAVRVDEQMCSSLPHIYAAGDCASITSKVTGKPVYLPLGTNANKQGKVLGEVLCGQNSRLPGVLGTSMCRVIDLEVARTGVNEREAQEAGIPLRVVSTTAHTRPPYYPGGCELTIKLFFHAETKVLLGAQLAGLEGAASRIGMCALAIDAGVTASQLALADLGYAPPFNYVWDPVQLAAGMVK